MKFFFIVYEIDKPSTSKKLGWTVIKAGSRAVAVRTLEFRDIHALVVEKWHVVICLEVGEIFAGCEKA